MAPKKINNEVDASVFASDLDDITQAYEPEELVEGLEADIEVDDDTKRRYKYNDGAWSYLGLVVNNVLAEPVVEKKKRAAPKKKEPVVVEPVVDADEAVDEAVNEAVDGEEPEVEKVVEKKKRAAPKKKVVEDVGEVVEKEKKVRKNAAVKKVVLEDGEEREVVRRPRKVVTLDDVVELMNELNIAEAKAQLLKFIEKHGSAGKGRRPKKVLAEGEVEPVKKLSAYTLFVQKTLIEMRDEGVIPASDRMREAMKLWKAHKEEGVPPPATDL